MSGKVMKMPDSSQSNSEAALTTNGNNQRIKPKRGGNRRDFTNYGYELAKPGDISKRVRAMKASLDQPPIDTSDPNAVMQRIWEYLDFCEKEDIKPEILSLSLWLHVSRDTLNSWKRGEYRGQTHSALIKNVITSLEALTVGLALDGKCIPGNVIFILKNHYGYKDNIEITTPKSNDLDNVTSAKDIADKYARLPEYSEYLVDEAGKLPEGQ